MSGKLCSKSYYTKECPVCSGRKVLASYNDLATTHPNVATEWHPTKNGDWTAKHAKAGQIKKFGGRENAAMNGKLPQMIEPEEVINVRTAQGKEFLRVLTIWQLSILR